MGLSQTRRTAIGPATARLATSQVHRPARSIDIALQPSQLEPSVSVQVSRAFLVVAFPVSLLSNTIGPPNDSTSHTPRPKTRVTSPALDTAIARMGGVETLRKIERVRFEMMTLWQRMTFDNRPNDMLGSYELHSDLRNYTLDSWRNTRRSIAGPNLREMIDVVGKEIAIRRLPTANGSIGPFAPLSIAYVDERKEIFAFAPERLLLSAQSANDLRVLADTMIARTPHARLSTTINGSPTTIFIRKTDGMLAMARYRAAQLNDFGLAPWGDMEVEMWYSRWAQYPLADTRGVVYPQQWDIKRVGQMYKRLVVLQANFNAVAPADSFAISDSLRTAFLAGASNKPMWDFAMDSARVFEGKFARFGMPGQGQNAVRIGTQWLFLEGTAVPQQQEKDLNWLRTVDASAVAGGLMITVPNTGRGGAAWFATRKSPVFIAPGTAKAMAETFANWKLPRTSGNALTKSQWLRIGGDSVWVEPIDYPDFPGAIVAYVPGMKWVYSGLAATPLNLSLLTARVQQRGWKVERYGTVRGLTEVWPAASGK